MARRVVGPCGAARRAEADAAADPRENIRGFIAAFEAGPGRAPHAPFRFLCRSTPAASSFTKGTFQTARGFRFQGQNHSRRSRDGWQLR